MTIGLFAISWAWGVPPEDPGNPGNHSAATIEERTQTPVGNLPGPAGLAAGETNSPIAVQGTAAMDDKIRLGIGDRLSFRILEDNEEARRLVITDAGDLEVPYIGRVQAQDKTCRELADEIKAKLEIDFYYQATVALALDQFNRSRGKVYLVGNVRSPGPLDIPSDEVFTVSKAAMRAGGFVDFSDKKRVRIVRGGGSDANARTVMVVDVGAVLEEGRIEKDVKVEPGDVIFIPGKLFNF